MASVTPKGGAALQRLQARTAPIAVQKGGEVEIPLDKIRFDPSQPRQAFHHPDGQIAEEDQLALEALAESIKTEGFLQAIIVEPQADGTYKIVAGERRTRAHILLGKATIRATLRTDLAESPKKRLIVQLVENIVREDLTDAERARSIRELMEGSETEPPMTQGQVAKALGKSEGWVSRYVRFSDEELQRLWIQTGIVDTVEHLYRVSVLPTPLQVEIQRRVALPEDDPDHIAKPIARAVLDEMGRQAKIVKAAEKAGRSGGSNVERDLAADPAPALDAGVEVGDGEARAEAPQSQGQGQGQDDVAAALAEAAAAGQAGAASDESLSSTATVAGTAYQLPDDVRASILAGVNATPDEGQRGGTAPAVPVRATFSSLADLLKLLDKDDAKAAANLQATITLPAPLAERLANKIAGVVVEPRAVSATIHRHLSDK